MFEKFKKKNKPRFDDEYSKRDSKKKDKNKHRQSKNNNKRKWIDHDDNEH